MNINEKKNGYGKIRINDTRIFNQAQEPFPFNERRETPHYTIIEGEWKDDILISNNSSIKGIKKEQTEKYLFN